MASGNTINPFTQVAVGPNSSLEEPGGGRVSRSTEGREFKFRNMYVLVPLTLGSVIDARFHNSSTFKSQGLIQLA